MRRVYAPIIAPLLLIIAILVNCEIQQRKAAEPIQLPTFELNEYLKYSDEFRTLLYTGEPR